LEYDGVRAAHTDDINQTINYQAVYKEIEEIMQHPVNLLETLCNKMLTMLKTKFPKIIRARATVHKMNPALGGGKVEMVSITMKTSSRY
jgi:dihydroneopterin aldolase